MLPRAGQGRIGPTMMWLYDTPSTAVLVGMSLLLTLGMLAMIELGRRLGYRRRERDPAGAEAGMSAVEGAVFALLGLLLAFQFSGAAQRFDARRELVTQETNAIGTSYLRLDLLPREHQPALR